MSELCPMAMISVRCRDGASHLPEEFASEAGMEWPAGRFHSSSTTLVTNIVEPAIAATSPKKQRTTIRDESGVRDF